MDDDDVLVMGVASIALVILGIVVAFFAVACLVAAAAVCVPAAASMFATHCYVRSALSERIRSPRLLASVLHPSFDGTTLTWNIDLPALSRKLKPRMLALVTLGVGIVLTALVLLLLSVGGTGIQRAGDWTEVVMVVGIPVFALGLLVYGYTLSARALVTHVDESAKEVVHRVADTLARTCVTSEGLDAETRRLALQMDFDWPFSTEAALSSFLQHQKGDFLVDAANLDHGISRILESGREDVRHLKEALALHSEIRASYDAVVEMATVAQASFLWRKLEQIDSGIRATSAQLLADRKWDDFRAVLEGIQADLQQVRNTFLTDGGAEPISSGELTLDDAYHLFGLSPATVTEQRVKTRYRELAKFYHPDSGATDDAMFKRVGRAHALIKEHQGYR